MSHTAGYSPLFDARRYFGERDGSFDYFMTERDSIGHGVVVEDPDALRESIKDTIYDDADFGETKRGEYPKQVFDKLFGFKTWDFDYYNIERLGFYYDPEEASRFWSEVSEHTEPFVVFESPGGFADVVDVVEDRASLKRITGCDGEVVVETFSFSSSVDSVDRYSGGKA